MLQNPVQCRIYRLGESFKFRKWADCIIGTSALLLDTMSSEISTKSNIGEGKLHVDHIEADGRRLFQKVCEFVGEAAAAR